MSDPGQKAVLCAKFCTTPCCKAAAVLNRRGRHESPRAAMNHKQNTQMIPSNDGRMLSLCAHTLSRFIGRSCTSYLCSYAIVASAIGQRHRNAKAILGVLHCRPPSMDVLERSAVVSRD